MTSFLTRALFSVGLLVAGIGIALEMVPQERVAGVLFTVAGLLGDVIIFGFRVVGVELPELVTNELITPGEAAAMAAFLQSTARGAILLGSPLMLPALIGQWRRRSMQG